MYQLTYSSISSDGLRLEDLNNILEEAKAKNASMNISGCLIHHNETFVQILEGNKQHVLEIFEKIKNDSRHHTIKLLWDNSIDQRYFVEWNMAFYRPKDNDSQSFVENILMLSEYSDKSTSALLSFWAEIGKVLRSNLLKR